MPNGQPNILVHALAHVTRMAATLEEFPLQQESASFTVGDVLDKLRAGLPSS